MAIRRVTGAVSPSELIFADANALGATYDGSGTTIERGETFTLPAGGTTAVSNGALRLEALKGDCTITNNGNSTLTNASGVDGTIVMRSGASDFPAFVRNSSMGSMSTPAREDFTGSLLGTSLLGAGTFDGTINSDATFPAGHIIKIQEFTNTDVTDTFDARYWRSVVSGAYATSNSSNKLLFQVQASIGKDASSTGLVGQITSKDHDIGTGSSLDHDGTSLPEGINPVSGNTNIQRVPFGMVGGNIYSNGDFIDYITGFIVHSPGTTNSKQYQFQCRGRTDSAQTYAVNRATNTSNYGFEIYGICRMLIMEFVV